MLTDAAYNEKEIQFLVDGFTNGFDIGYQGPVERKSESQNIPFTPGVGNKFVMWNKIMKEVEAKRVASPFKKIPFDNYIQSPIGLVPKKGNKTRLIFHLSYDFTDDGSTVELSLNACTPRDICTVKYNDLDQAVRNCIMMSKKAEIINGTPVIYLSKTDLSNAFRVLPLNIKCLCWLVFKAVDPSDGKVKYFVDKCLPFGASISCALYQRFSNALRFIIQHKTGEKAITNYLDDFLFIAMLRSICNELVIKFMQICRDLGVPVADEKMEYATTMIVFLGILLNGRQLTLSIPIEKQEKALKLLNEMMDRKKATIKQIQVLTGYLKFLTRAIEPGRAFTRRMYAKCAAYENVTIDREFRFDCNIWKTFLTHYRDQAVCHSMVDLNETILATELNFYSDASANKRLGFGAVFGDKWLYGQWEPDYIVQNKPSIEYLELFALAAALLTWGEQIKNNRVIIFCDNLAVVSMINTQSSKCKNCMYLLRLVMLNNLVHNRRLFAKHVRSENNSLADSLSRLQFHRFWKLAKPTMEKEPTRVTPLIWPASQIWQKC